MDLNRENVIKIVDACFPILTENKKEDIIIARDDLIEFTKFIMQTTIETSFEQSVKDLKEIQDELQECNKININIEKICLN